MSDTIGMLREAQSLYERSKKNLDTTIENRKKIITACLNNGHSVIEIANVLGLSRQRVYKIIEKG
ncbi:MAG: helix-turn-helix domain-containing protein [Rhodospirillaceae bacterium]|jgi:DNA-directed RNA polymerase specialized sigma subunit|tara:strand:- start:859 stop:1053 length:195 start_codon:yes stop_codon:yes gene_type:complete